MKIIQNNNVFFEFEYFYEEQLERDIANNADTVFGERCIYFDMKKKFGNTVPDGYLICITEYGDVYLYLVEIELAYHDVSSHLLPRLLKFAEAYDDNKEKLYHTLLDEMDDDKLHRIRTLIADTSFNNEKELIEFLLKDNLRILIILDCIEDQLVNELEQIRKMDVSIETEVFKKFIYGNKIQYFTTIGYDTEEGIEDYRESFEDVEDDCDTIIVAADIESFENIFLGENCWYTVKMAEYRIKDIRYIAAYLIRPYCHITHYAKVENIVPYEDGYKILFKGKPIHIPEIPRGEDTFAMHERIRYTTYENFMNADTVTDMFEY